VKIVHHAEIMQSSGANKEIPTNNFWAIHTALHRIPGLAPWFLKIDDDALLNRQVQVSDLFTSKGQARIRCPVGEVVWPHCPTLRNTCVMRQLEHHFASRVSDVLTQRSKSKPNTRPSVVLWLEHHNWMVSHGYAVWEPESDGFGVVNTNDWQKGTKWVNETWARVMKQEDKSLWLNFQGQGISWEYEANAEVTNQFEQWLSSHKLNKNGSTFVKRGSALS
jgi:hypothetical protein